MKQSKRFLSLILAFVLILGAGPVQAAEALSNNIAISDRAASERLESGKYVLVDSNNQVPGVLGKNWVTRSDVAADPTSMTNFIMTLEISGDKVKIKDSSGKYLAPNGGNNNGIKEGEYSWLLVDNGDGTYSFKGQGKDTVTFANNTMSNSSGYRAYKNTTVSGNQKNNYFTDFKLIQVEKSTEPTDPTPTDPTDTENPGDNNPTEPESNVLTIKEARDASGEVTTKGIVTFLDGKNITIQDDTAGIVFRVETYDHGYNLGDEIKVTGIRGNFNGIEQINGNTSNTEKISTKELPTPKEVTISEILTNGENYESQRVILKDVQIGSESNNNTPITQNGNTINIYRLNPTFAPNANSKINLIAVVGQFNDYQLRVAQKSDITILSEGEGPLPFENYKKISEIQGTKLVSPMVGQNVEIKGVVISGSDDYFNKGYYIHSLKEDMDEDPRTSEALFVQTNWSGANRGDIVTVSGTVAERKFMSSWSDQLTVTSLSNGYVNLINEKYDEAQLDELVTHINVVDIPTKVSSVNFDKASHGNVEINRDDAIGFYESLENMPVKISDAEIVAQVEGHGDITVLPNRGEGASVIRTESKGVKYTYENPNTQTITISDKIIPITNNKQYIDSEFRPYPGKVFDGDIEGVFVYAFSYVKLLNYKPLPELKGEGVGPEGPSELKTDYDSITATIYNVLNFSAKDTDRAPMIAKQIVNKLNAPDLVALVEIQDNDGPGKTNIQDATETLELLVSEIAKAGGPKYEYLNIDPQPGNKEGGQPHANIRPAFLYNPKKLKLAESKTGGASSPEEEIELINDNGALKLKQNPSRFGLSLQGSSFKSTRLPLVGQFEILKGEGAGEKITFINNHLSSKGGDTPIIGPVYPQVRGSEVKRHAQAEALAGLVNEMRKINPDEHIVVMGDLNDYEFSETLGILTSKAKLANLIEKLPENARSSYSYQGNSQVLDHILVSPSLNKLSPEVDMVNINANYRAIDGSASDHDPVLAKFSFKAKQEDDNTDKPVVNPDEPTDNPDTPVVEPEKPIDKKEEPIVNPVRPVETDEDPFAYLVNNDSDKDRETAKVFVSTSPVRIDSNKDETKSENKYHAEVKSTEVNYIEKTENFRPNDKATRNDIIEWLDEILKFTGTKPEVNLEFSDLNKEQMNVLEKFIAAGAVDGYPDGTFRPENPITRAEFVKILEKLFNLGIEDGSTNLSDISGHWAEKSIVSMVQKGLIKGYPDGTFRPDENITRAEVITLINRVAGLDTKVLSDHNFADLDENHWAYKEIMASVK
ncbi:S-layer homology domain-containing protein [Peptoniphilus sp. MSJ-1]|uniref:S-layer homology domain-containing protein n=1 Tax=Peptoniphilus ovalis TaxID=2841503 RepID=A0ABS6FE02_9FIRM|nr:S-layer homology domain-containing protein [Peptoniphilus ovalis]MBU5668409.1 S-layer homology domain-containing protein [Peptoniphilus ovalis]